MKRITLAALVLILSLITGSANAVLDCSITGEYNCPLATNTILVYLSGDGDNAHLTNQPSQFGYSTVVCCNETSGTQLGTSCSGIYDTFLKLSSPTNAHAEAPEQSGFPIPTELCLSIVGGVQVDCQSSETTNCVTVGTDYECVIALSDWTNAHSFRCTDQQQKKICCKTIAGLDVWLNPLPTWTRADFFTVSWTAQNPSAVDKYEVHYNVNGGAWIFWDNETSNSKIFGPVSPVTVADGSTYSFRVRAWDYAGHSGDWSAEESTTIDLTPPTCDMMDLPAFSDTIFWIEWNGYDETSGILYYNIEQQINEGGWNTMAAWTNTSDISYQIFNAIEGYNYSFRCMAWDNAGWAGPWSELKSTVIDASDPVSNLKPLLEWVSWLSYPPWINLTQINITWSGLDATIECYDVQWSENGVVSSLEVPNNGFEDGSGPGADDWTEGNSAGIPGASGSHFRSSDKAAVGSWSIKSDFTNPGSEEIATVSDVIVVELSTAYDLSGWIYNSLGEGSAYITVFEVDEQPPLWACSANTSIKDKWQYVSCRFVTPTDMAAPVEIRLVTKGPISGNVWFDNVTLEKSWEFINFDGSDTSCTSSTLRRWIMFDSDTTSVNEGDSFYFRIRSRDFAGHQEAYHKEIEFGPSPDGGYLSMTIDLTIPELNTIILENNTHVEIRSTAKDLLSGVWNNTIHYDILEEGTLTSYTKECGTAAPSVESTCHIIITLTEGMDITYYVIARDRAGNMNQTDVYFVTFHPLANFHSHNIYISLGQSEILKVRVKNVGDVADTVTVWLTGEGTYPSAYYRFVGAGEYLGGTDQSILVPLEPHSYKDFMVRIDSVADVEGSPYTLNLNASSTAYPLAAGPRLTDSDQLWITIGYPAEFPGLGLEAIIVLMALAVMIIYFKEANIMYRSRRN